MSIGYLQGFWLVTLLERSRKAGSIGLMGRRGGERGLRLVGVTDGVDGLTFSWDGMGWVQGRVTWSRSFFFIFAVGVYFVELHYLILRI